MGENPKLRTGVRQGGGPPPGYRWTVGILDAAFEESCDLLTKAGHQHLALQVKELAGQDDPTHSETVDVKPIETFHELRDKGGPLGSLNVRLFFGVDHHSRNLIVLGVIKKQNNGMTPIGDKVRMRRRWREYQKGSYGRLLL